MKLATYVAADGRERIGTVDASRSRVLDLQEAHVAAAGRANPAFESMQALIEAGPEAWQAARSLDAAARPELRVALSNVRLLSPVPRPVQVRDCNNYEQHMRDARFGMETLKARLAGRALPQRGTDEPPIAPVNFRHIVFYITNRMSVVGPEVDVRWPAYSEYMDYEAEFGVFIGKAAKDVSKAEAAQHIFGYSILNDFSARDQQAEEMEGRMGPTKGKSFDTGNVIGPWIVTPDEIPDPRALNVEVRVNGERRAGATTAGMIHGFDDIIAYLSKNETLHPGEFIGGGTVGGCCGLETDSWLKDGDVVEIEFDRIGVLRNRLVRG